MGEVLSAKLSRSTTFVSISPEDFERQLRPVFGDTAEKIADSYRFTQDHAALYESINMDETYICLPVKPLTFEAWCDTMRWEIDTAQRELTK